MKINFCLTLTLVIILLPGASAQKNWNKQNGTITPWEIGLSGGVSTFLTSVNPEPGAPNGRINYWNREVNPGIGLSVVRNISPSLAVEINWLNTRLTGKWNDKWPAIGISAFQETPTTFNSRISQFDLMVAFNVNQMMLPGDEEDLWHIYFKTGIGIAHIKDNKNFFPGDSPYTKLSLALDAGVSVSISEKLKLLAGSTFRFVNTDNLDGVHVVSADMNGHLTGWMKVYEIYNYTYLSVNYRLSDFGLKKSKATVKHKNGKFRVYRRRR